MGKREKQQGVNLIYEQLITNFEANARVFSSMMFSVIKLLVFKFRVIMLLAECHYDEDCFAECHYDEYCYAGCHYSYCFYAEGFIQSVLILCDVMLRVIISFILAHVVMLNVVMPILL